jgi:hypothetical protein
MAREEYWIVIDEYTGTILGESPYYGSALDIADEYEDPTRDISIYCEFRDVQVED